ncbi:hypothetical protein GXM_06731 [Nostoc sphaeroides CCNUC1]|uniref:Uncharacterized protein n=1 Tax=Nostoc sphaeroides CCNUC1 TaxID=2653204 RepID=A0A5P8W8W2_9NOSO|nr:hypothetical protein GXM_06731 [Nostoc sphaeroides CCNUC1]
MAVDGSRVFSQQSTVNSQQSTLNTQQFAYADQTPSMF